MIDMSAMSLPSNVSQDGNDTSDRSNSLQVASLHNCNVFAPTSSSTAEPFTAPLNGPASSWGLRVSSVAGMEHHMYDLGQPFTPLVSPFTPFTQDSSGFTMAPTPTLADWNSPSAAMDAHLPPAYRQNVVSLSSPTIVTPNQSELRPNALTGLSPMFANFSTSPLEVNFSSSTTRPGPTRYFSAGSAPVRNRSFTLHTPPPNSSSASCPYPPYKYYSANASPTGRLFRPPSTPQFTSHSAAERRIFHPSPAGSAPLTGLEFTNLALDRERVFFRPLVPGIGIGMGGGEKPPRFKPTKGQLAILVKAYEENKNPDSAAREALAKKLGPEVRPKTLQIWFQNRRSKSRAKERDAAHRKLQDGSPQSKFPSQQDGSMSSNLSSGSLKCIEPNSVPSLDALRVLVGDDSDLTLLPISVLSISGWTRFLTPGTGSTHPDLAAAIRFSSPSQSCSNPDEPPILHIYVLHTLTFRIDIPLHPHHISNLHATSNPAVNTNAVAIQFEVAPGIATYHSRSDEKEEVKGEWREIGDFTGGEAGKGGKCEITGIRESLIPAFIKIQQYLANTLNSAPMTAGLCSQVAPAQSMSISNWKFPGASTTSASTSGSEGIKTSLLETIKHDTEPSIGVHKRQRSFSQPLPLPTDLCDGILNQPFLPLPVGIPLQSPSSLTDESISLSWLNTNFGSWTESLPSGSLGTAYIQTPVTSYPTSVLGTEAASDPYESSDRLSNSDQGEKEGEFDKTELMDVEGHGKTFPESTWRSPTPLVLCPRPSGEETP
ncbi:hypothetical protein L204_104478 [Cryptococcus depauperatus]